MLGYFLGIEVAASEIGVNADIRRAAVLGHSGLFRDLRSVGGASSEPTVTLAHEAVSRLVIRRHPFLNDLACQRSHRLFLAASHYPICDRFHRLGRLVPSNGSERTISIANQPHRDAACFSGASSMRTLPFLPVFITSSKSRFAELCRVTSIGAGGDINDRTSDMSGGG